MSLLALFWFFLFWAFCCTWRASTGWIWKWAWWAFVARVLWWSRRNRSFSSRWNGSSWRKRKWPRPPHWWLTARVWRSRAISKYWWTSWWTPWRTWKSWLGWTRKWPPRRIVWWRIVISASTSLMFYTLKNWSKAPFIYYFSQMIPFIIQDTVDNSLDLLLNQCILHRKYFQ